MRRANAATASSVALSPNGDTRLTAETRDVKPSTAQMRNSLARLPAQGLDIVPTAGGRKLKTVVGAEQRDSLWGSDEEEGRPRMPNPVRLS
jgi:hypothetical protein